MTLLLVALCRFLHPLVNRELLSISKHLEYIRVSIILRPEPSTQHRVGFLYRGSRSILPADFSFPVAPRTHALSAIAVSTALGIRFRRNKFSHVRTDQLGAHSPPAPSLAQLSLISAAAAAHFSSQFTLPKILFLLLQLSTYADCYFFPQGNAKSQRIKMH